MKLHLANTDKSCDRLLGMLETAGTVGFDTESAGPLLRNRTWKEGKSFINEHCSHTIGFSIAFPAPTLDEVPDSWKKKDGQLKAGRELEPTAFYVPIRHNKKNAKWDAIDAILKKVANVENVWWHNSKHDYKMLLLMGYPFPLRNSLDTFVASLLADPERKSHGLKALAFDLLGRESPEFDPVFYQLTGKAALEYACHDAVNTLELGALLEGKLREQGLWDWFVDTESQFPLVLGEMERWGMGLNFDKLRKLSAECDVVMAEQRQLWDETVPKLYTRVDGESVRVPIDIGSSAQLQVLFEKGIWKQFKKTPGGMPGTDRDCMEAQERLLKKGSDGIKLAQIRLDYQAATKIATTYTLGLIEEAKQFPDRRIHPNYNQGGAGTGRLSSSNPNGQNIPVRSEQGRKVKAAIIPAPGYVFLAADYSQIELRVLAHYCGGKLAEAYLNGEDVHQQTADLVGCSRDDGKTLNFAIVYGAGPWTLAKQLKTDKKNATNMQQEFFRVYPRIPKFMKQLVAIADSRGAHPYVKTLTGRRIYIPQLLESDYGSRQSGIRKAGNAPIQGGAFDIMKIGMTRVRTVMLNDDMLIWNHDIRCVNNLHDEVTYEVRAEEALIRRATNIVQRELESAFELRVPLVAEPKVGNTWAEVK